MRMRHWLATASSVLAVFFASSATAQQPVKPTWDAEKAAKTITEAAKEQSGGKCATHVRQALEAGGMTIKENDRVKDAKDYGKFLTERGFEEVPGKDYTPQKGDIVVIQPYKGGSESGHIAMYTGTEWVSDFKQRYFWGGPGYRNNKPAHAFYRWKK